MGIIRYIDKDGIRETPDKTYGGTFYYNNGNGAKAISRLKIEETEYDPKTKRSKVQVTVQVNTGHTWNVSKASDLTDYVKIQGLTRVTVGGKAVTLVTQNPKTVGSGTWFDAATGTVELANRENGSTACTVNVASDNPKSNCCTWWHYKPDYFPIAQTGNHSMPLTKVDDGSKVKIGGENYHIYIGNGTGWVKHNAYIGNGTEWVKH